MIRYFIGIDNGVTGTIAVIDDKTNGLYFSRMPVKEHLDYTKKKQWIRRIDITPLKEWLSKILSEESYHCFFERPMINPARFKATMSALRALEATLILLEDLKIPYEYIDSKQWQRVLIPKGVKEKNLKKAAFQVACRLFPQVAYLKNKDVDGILIAEYCRRVKKGQVK
ncbi:hypothetical protein DRN98_04710 [Methanosarcinales archaeon]|nr:MAG: hypothetical protein DRN98_04710 [Methanosarcinales archaeon]